jgi:hypothetical protein
MEDFRVEDLYYLHSPPNAPDSERSIHRAYPIRLTARDMARFGHLFLRQGNWRGKQIVTPTWVSESTKAHAKVGKDRYTESGLNNPWNGGGYAYCWWVDGLGLPLKSYSARGAMGKYIVVIPERNLVLVYQNHAEEPDDTTKLTEQGSSPSAFGTQLAFCSKSVGTGGKGTGQLGPHGLSSLSCIFAIGGVPSIRSTLANVCVGS